MTSIDTPTAVQLHTIPAESRAYVTFAEPYYIDVFALPIDAVAQGSPEQWARALFEQAAGKGGQFIWGILLTMRLARPGTPGHVAGWRIGDRGPDWIRLEVEGWMLDGQLVVRAGERELIMVTAVRYPLPIGRPVWNVLSRVHRRLTPGLLANGFRIMTRNRAAEAAAGR
ncbi:hypothetical protein [Nocardia concava]|uniref:hypothetical protein n=1 Tax=Nocardia concava TaxID=257281 RepID=UPI000318867D|nr:hypothetical protein [Nocardia concava]